MTAWGDDPELLATFRAEVEERLASLQSGLLALERRTASPRQVVGGLFRDAHTVKGSARMLGLTASCASRTRMEDLLGALRDGRFAGTQRPGRPAARLLRRHRPRAARRRARRRRPRAARRGAGGRRRRRGPGAGARPARRRVPAQPAVGRVAVAHVRRHRAAARRPPPRRRSCPPPPTTVVRSGSDSVRVAATKVYELLDVVGEADLGARRIEQTTGQLLRLAAEQARWAAPLRPPPCASGHPAAGRRARAAPAGRRRRRAVRRRPRPARARRGPPRRHGPRARRRDGPGDGARPTRARRAAADRARRRRGHRQGPSAWRPAGEDVEIDKQVLDGVADALKHLVVNAVDHGCEDAATRTAAGKPAEARRPRHRAQRRRARSCSRSPTTAPASTRTASAPRPSSSACCPPTPRWPARRCVDLLFAPAFSTASTVTETSGRGVGLDVVRDAVEELGGAVEVRSERGAGTTFVLTLPVTLGVLRCLLARVGDERYAVPVPGVVESLSLRDAEVHVLAGAPVVVRHGVSLPLLDLGAALGLPGRRATRPGPPSSSATAAARRSPGPSTGSRASASSSSRTSATSSAGCPPSPARPSTGTAPSSACSTCASSPSRSSGSARPPRRSPPRARAAAARRTRVVPPAARARRRGQRRRARAGAGHPRGRGLPGRDGRRRPRRASRLRDDPADLVLSDVEMPGMDGFELTRTIRRTKGWENVPVIIMTSRGEDARPAGGPRRRLLGVPAQERVRPGPAGVDSRRLVGR